VADPRDHYEVLGVATTADSDEIKSAYKRLALKYHPDRNPGNTKAESQFKEINEAYQILSDSSKKAVYDLNRTMRPNQVKPGVGFTDTALQDMMEELFRQTDFGAFRTVRRAPSTQEIHRKNTPGDDILIDLEISLEESVSGCKKPVIARGPRPDVTCGHCEGSGSKHGSRKIICTMCAGSGKGIGANGRGVRNCQHCGGAGNRPLEHCNHCGGNGRVIYVKELAIQIPSGVAAGQQLRIAGQGTPGHPPGNLFITIKVSANKNFWRDGNDLHTTKRVSLRHAVMGGPIVFLGLDGQEVNLNVPPGTQPGDMVRMAGCGVLGPLSKKSGDLIVHVEVALPRAMSARAKKLMDELMDELSRGPQGQ